MSWSTFIHVSSANLMSSGVRDILLILSDKTKKVEKKNIIKGTEHSIDQNSD